MKLYNTKTRSLSISDALGDTRVRAGSSVIVKLGLGDINVQSYLLVESVTHKFKQEQHLMDLKLSLDMNGFLENVKRAAVEAVAAGKPFGFILGKVTSVSPLKVQVDQKLELTASQLILTNAVRDFTVYMTVDHQTEETSGGSGYAEFASHKHAYKGKKAYKVHLALKTGEQVLLLRADGGQKFIILDRVEAPK